MANINPFSLINNPRLTPSLPDHSAVQKLLTDSHIQQSKNKAAAARNLLDQQTGFANKLVGENLHPGQEFISRIGMNPAGLAQALQTSRGLADRKSASEISKNLAGALETGTEASWTPNVRSGSFEDMIKGGGIFTNVRPTTRQIVEKHETKTKQMQPGGPNALGAAEVTTTTGQTQKGSPVGQVANSLPAIISGQRWDMVKRPIKRTADYLKITPEQLMQKIEAGLRDGSVQLIGTKQIVIDGQPFTWFN